MEINDLYRDVILDHNRRPRNFGALEPADASVEGFNPMCGDRLTVRLKMNDDKISDIRFEGQGCAISTASASLMTEAVKGRTRAEALRLFDRTGARNDFAKALVTQAALRRDAGDLPAARELLNQAHEIFVTLGTSGEPARVKAALAALDHAGRSPGG